MLLILTLILGIALIFRPSTWRASTLHERIREHLNDSIADSEKLDRISAYVTIGDTTEEIQSTLGHCWDFETNKEGLFRHCYDSGLVINFYPDGISYAIGYYPTVAIPGRDTIHWLSFPDTIDASGHDGPGLQLDLDSGQTEK